ncbi:target of rapamycin complex 2 subunit MAPKAP1-like [Ptychodera flava]|uniref:target of rapamycin complex 2 subunit MAPKAP1-like n=1 Tax=Ptychodera flava TaxID=63121 RepID=UPI00396A30A3
MALLDDPSFIIAHIRHAYLTSDDTGMSEMVIVNEDNDYRAREKVKDKGHSSEVNKAILDEYGYHDKDNYAESYDIESSFDIDVEGTLFEKREVKVQKANGISALAVQLEKFPHQTNNPFNEYAKFDGTVSPARTCIAHMENSGPSRK